MNNKNKTEEIFNKILEANEKLGRIAYLKKKIIKVKHKNYSGSDKRYKNKDIVIYYNQKIKQVKENSWYGGINTIKENILIEDYLYYEEIRNFFLDNYGTSLLFDIDELNLVRPTYLKHPGKRKILVQEYSRIPEDCLNIEMYNYMCEEYTSHYMD